MVTRMRYFANGVLKKRRDEETGEITYYAIGEEMDPSVFASGQALQAAIHVGAVSAVPVLDPGDDVEQAIAAGRSPTNAQRGKGLPNTRN